MTEPFAATGTDDLDELRARVGAEFDNTVDEARFDHLAERVDTPVTDPAAEWDAAEAVTRAAAEQARLAKAEAAIEFERRFAGLSAQEATRLVEAEPRRWLPATELRRRRRERYADLRILEPTPEEKLMAAILDEPLPEPGIDRVERVRSRARTARQAALRRDIDRPRDLPEDRWADLRLPIWEKFNRDVEAVAEAFTRVWGMNLPDSYRRFHAFVLTLGPFELRAMGYLDLFPYGMAAQFTDLAADEAQDTILARGRAYRDPPEFVTFLHGGSDGLHFGLWFDDGVDCDGVCSFYNNDGGGVGEPSGTPLEAIRDRLETAWQRTFDEFDGAGPAEDEDALTRFHCLSRLRTAVTAFETARFPQEGDDYAAARRAATAQPQRPQRLPTLDEGGARAGDEPPSVDGPDHDRRRSRREELTKDPSARAARVAEARRRCESGEPADALVLGRDLHWVAGKDPDIEREAAELLEPAYRALGRDNLARITRAHHQWRRGLDR